MKKFQKSTYHDNNTVPVTKGTSVRYECNGEKAGIRTLKNKINKYISALSKMCILISKMIELMIMFK